jgi:hypothetical protein
LGERLDQAASADHATMLISPIMSSRAVRIPKIMPKRGKAGDRTGEAARRANLAAKAKPGRAAPLNARQEAFARGVAAGKSQRQAYCDAGYSCTNDGSTEAAAVQLLRNIKVTRRIAKLQGKAAERVEITIELISRKLLDAYDAALRFEQAGAAVAAMTALARLLGLNAVERIDLKTHVIPMRRGYHSIDPK